MQSRKLIFFLSVAGILMVSGWVFAAVKMKQPEPRLSQPYLAASIYPLYDIVRNVAGPDNPVVLILPPGTAPETYRITNADREKLRGIKYVFTTGQNIDAWTKDLAADTGALQLIPLDDNVQLVPASPYYWLSLKNAEIMVRQVASVLSQDDPSHAAVFSARAENYRRQLNELYRYGETRAKQASISAVLAGDGWPYIAADYDISASSSGEPTLVTLELYGGSIDKDTYLNLMSSNLDAVFKATP